MNRDALLELLKRLHDRNLTPEAVLEQLKTLPFENLGFAHVDHHRPLRSGMPEVIYCAGKSPEQIVSIIQSLNRKDTDILATRLSAEVHATIEESLPDGARYNPLGRTLVIHGSRRKPPAGHILILTAGTSDIPVAEEAADTASLLGSRVEKIFDVGVAGIHRLLDKVDQLRAARVLIVVAGMEGALVSVIGGLVDRPVIGVPTSVGYGASFGGVAALLTMLNSCAAGVSVVNIDNGFGAGCIAHRINLLAEPEGS